MRTKVAQLQQKFKDIVWRSHEPSRLETFSDAVFGFALTLIIVSIEVPKTFDELEETMKGGISFAVCFAVLFQIWNNQNIFFRRYGLKDTFTVLLNAVLLFVVLIYAYPLKFLTVLLFSNGTTLHEGHQIAMIRPEQIKPLMMIYGAGFAVIYLLFFLMYRNAAKRAHEAKLTDQELFHTRTVAGINIICMLICLAVMTLTYTATRQTAGKTGFFYFMIPFGYMIWYRYRAKKARRLFTTPAKLS